MFLFAACAPFKQQSTEVFLLLDNGGILHSRLSISDSGIMRQQGHASTILWQHNQTPLGSVMHSTEADSEWRPEQKRVGTTLLSLAPFRSLRASQKDFSLRVELAEETAQCELNFDSSSWTVRFSEQWSNGWLHAAGTATALKGIAMIVERQGLVTNAPVSELIVGSTPGSQLLWAQVGDESKGCLNKGSEMLSAEHTKLPTQKGEFSGSNGTKTLGIEEPYANHTILDHAALWSSGTPMSHSWNKLVIEEPGARWSAFHRAAR